jgi:outer membrane receptor protein involved in Fe transport
VLRGPQGTLFGKNSSAGVVNVISKRPGDEFGGFIDLGWYEDDEKRVKASIDAPISDTLKTRTTVTWGEFDGYIDNISTTAAGGKLNGYDRKGIRTIWVADPSDKTPAHLHRRVPRIRRQLLRRSDRQPSGGWRQCRCHHVAARRRGFRR